MLGLLNRDRTPAEPETILRNAGPANLCPLSTPSRVWPQKTRESSEASRYTSYHGSVRSSAWPIDETLARQAASGESRNKLADTRVRTRQRFLTRRRRLGSGLAASNHPTYPQQAHSSLTGGKPSASSRRAPHRRQVLYTSRNPLCRPPVGGSEFRHGFPRTRDQTGRPRGRNPSRYSASPPRDSPTIPQRGTETDRQA
jgi:hypothetical protein